MVFLPSMVILQLHFDKKRALAVGIGTTGLSIGGMLAPPLFDTLLTQYGLAGTYIMLSGILLHSAICVSFFRPIRLRKSTYKVRVHENKRVDRKCSQQTDTVISYISTGQIQISRTTSLDNDLTQECNKSGEGGTLNLGYDNVDMNTEGCDDEPKCSPNPKPNIVLEVTQTNLKVDTYDTKGADDTCRGINCKCPGKQNEIQLESWQIQLRLHVLQL